MGKLGLFVGVLALALAAYGAMELCAKDEAIAELDRKNERLLDRVTVLEAKLADALITPPDANLRSADSGHVETGNTLPGLSGRAATPLDRLAALEETVTTQNELIAQLKKKDALASSPRSSVHRVMNDRFYANLDMAASAMKLKENQKADIKDLQERALQELKDLYALENDDGMTWNEARKPKMVSGEGISFAMPDMAKLSKFKKGRIPGSSETFGQAEKRIRKDAFGRMRNVLTSDQAKKWDKAHKEGLLRGGGSSFATMSFVGLDVATPGDK